MKCIYTNKGADPQAPYSQAMVTGESRIYSRPDRTASWWYATCR